MNILPVMFVLVLRCSSACFASLSRKHERYRYLKLFNWIVSYSNASVTVPMIHVFFIEKQHHLQTSATESGKWSKFHRSLDGPNFCLSRAYEGMCWAHVSPMFSSELWKSDCLELYAFYTQYISLAPPNYNLDPNCTCVTSINAYVHDCHCICRQSLLVLNNLPSYCLHFQQSVAARDNRFPVQPQVLE